MTDPALSIAICAFYTVAALVAGWSLHDSFERGCNALADILEELRK